jgi:succinoglycan biosynthesis protein ExoA
MIYTSVIIPVRNEEKFIAETLLALANQDYPHDRVEILVIDGMSTDNTREEIVNFMQNHPDITVRLLENPGLLSSRARNIGVKEAKGSLIAVIDAHVYIPDEKLLKSMEKLREKTGAKCLSRPAPLTVPDIKNNSTAYWIALARKSWLGHSQSTYIYSDYEGFVDPVSSGFAYAREVFKQVGYFDESFDAAEDVEFHHRLKKAGILAYTSPRFLIYSYPRESLTELFKQQTRYGEGRARFITKHNSGISIETFIPAGIFLFFISLPIIIMLGFSSIIINLYMFLALCYLSILLITGLRIAFNEKKPAGALFIAAAIWVTHMGLGWGFLKRIILNKRK